ncbi:MAG: hypothetical protein JRJ65_07490 [Deltaproteobacteria bacterium]|nr:hypothetical protein [Deltaproteobacteria bacterium]
MWSGFPVAYLYNEEHVYGINGRHLGWVINEVIYNVQGERIGFTSNTCPVIIAKEPGKAERRTMDEIRPRWSAPPLPKLSFNLGSQGLTGFLMKGQVVQFHEEVSTEESPDL